jgi:hypothetical protein
LTRKKTYIASRELLDESAIMNRDWSIASQKATNAIVEGLAFEMIRRFYEAQGIKMNRIDYNSALDLTGKQAFDLVDGYGKTWEVKSDRLWHQTGNVFLEHEAVEHSKADYFLIFAGLTYILPRETVLELLEGPYRNVRGGDDLRATGTLVPLSQLQDWISTS